MCNIDMRSIRSGIALAIITCCAFVIYSNIYHFPFVFDGGAVIEENSEIRSLENYLSFEELSQSRGVVYLTFALNYKFSELTPNWYHFVNVVVHVICGFISYFLALTILRQIHFQARFRSPYPPGIQCPIADASSIMQLMALFTALIFITHPLQTQAVTYTVQRCASMAAMFYLGSVLFYLKGRIIQQERKEERQKHNNRNRPVLRLDVYFALSIIFGILSFLSKANAASLPGVIILSEYLFIDRSWHGWKKHLPWFFLAFLLWLLFVSYASGVFSGGVEGRGLLEDVSRYMKETEEVSRWQYLCTEFNVLVQYIGLLFFPIGQNVDHMYPFASGFFDGYTPLAFLLLMGIIGIGVWNIKRHPAISFGIFWYFITLSVESSIIPISDAMFEHRLYLPMFGFAFILTYTTFYFLSKRRLWAISVCTAIILIFGSVTYSRNRIWQDEFTLWSDSVSKNPQNYRAHNNLGVPLINKGEYEKAMQHYRTALKIKPRWALVHYNLGVAKEVQGKYEEAIEHYLEAIEIKPDYAKAHNNLGTLFLGQGKVGLAADHYLKAVKNNPNDATAHSNLGIALTRKGKLDEAISHFREALRLRPDDDRIRYNLEQVIKQRDKIKGNQIRRR